MCNSPLDELIRRFDEGDRSPATLASLNRAAWTWCHDPWEARPEFRVAAGGPEEGPRGAAAEAVRRILDQLRWKYDQQDRCAFTCVPPAHAWKGLEPALRFEEAGNGDLVFRLMLGAPFAGEALRSLVRLAGAWTWAGRRPLPELEPAPGPGPEALPLFSTLRLEDRTPMRGSVRAMELWLKGCMVEANRFLELVEEGSRGKA